MIHIKSIISLATCVCAQDGVVSEIELDTIFHMISESNYKIEKSEFNLIIDQFFEEDKSLEFYFEGLERDDDYDFIVKLCHESAASDGLEARENMALIKLLRMMGRDPEDFFNNG